MTETLESINAHNPHAFPSVYPLPQHAGMLLRDYIAVHAMQALIDGAARGDLEIPSGVTPATQIADQAYHMADAMLAERANGDGTGQHVERAA